MYLVFLKSKSSLRKKKCRFDGVKIRTKAFLKITLFKKEEKKSDKTPLPKQQSLLVDKF